MDLPHSDAAFVMAFPAETSEAFAEGHNQAFAHFGAVPQSIVYDNTKLAVAKILGDGGAAAHASIHRTGLALFIPGTLRPSRQRQ
jgi:transposase